MASLKKQFQLDGNLKKKIIILKVMAVCVDPTSTLAVNITNPWKFI